LLSTVLVFGIALLFGFIREGVVDVDLPVMPASTSEQFAWLVLILKNQKQKDQPMRMRMTFGRQARCFTP
jgi:hypothetical protein